MRLSRSSRAHSCIFTIASSWAKEKSGSSVSILWIQTVMLFLHPIPIGCVSLGSGNGQGEGGLDGDLVSVPDESKDRGGFQVELPDRQGEFEIERDVSAGFLQV